jgi:Family of unknown function (DUF6352)
VREFWVSSGHHLTRRMEGGRLAVTDELILAYLARRELFVPEAACRAERDLHAALMDQPRRLVSRREIEALADPDARENWEVMVAFRDRLLAMHSIEAAYLDLVRRGTAGTPPLFLNQLVHLILRNALDECDDPHVLRAAEMLFRPQRVSFQNGTALLADAEVLDMLEPGAGHSPLVAMLGQEPMAELDVLNDDNAWTYWSRSDAFTMILDIGSDPKARQGIALVIAAWVGHLLRVRVQVEPITAIEERDWRWFVGLDADATRIGNALWNGEMLDEDAYSRVLALFRLTFDDAGEMESEVAGHPVYILLAMTPDKLVRVKPQNLIEGLPVRVKLQVS